MRSYLRTLMTAGLVLTGAAATAQQMIVVNVPFEFSAGTNDMARGAYEISRAPYTNSAYLVRGVRGGAFVMGQPEDSWSADRDQTPSLIFHRYGNQNFLREIRLGNGTAVMLPESKEESNSARQRAAAFEEVAVLARR